jgi:hypothetical protein
LPILVNCFAILAKRANITYFLFSKTRPILYDYVPAHAGAV